MIKFLVMVLFGLFVITFGTYAGAESRDELRITGFRSSCIIRNLGGHDQAIACVYQLNPLIVATTRHFFQAARASAELHRPGRAGHRCHQALLF